MSNRNTHRQVVQALVAVVGTGLAFAFLHAGAFRDLGRDTVRRMLTPDGLRAALLGAGVTAVLLAPVLVWQWRRNRRQDG